jgi:hypothetical protein
VILGLEAKTQDSTGKTSDPLKSTDLPKSDSFHPREKEERGGGERERERKEEGKGKKREGREGRRKETPLDVLLFSSWFCQIKQPLTLDHFSQLLL